MGWSPMGMVGSTGVECGPTTVSLSRHITPSRVRIASTHRTQARANTTSASSRRARFSWPAYFAGYASVDFNLYYQNNLVWTSATLATSGTPTFLASGYSGPVDTVGVYATANDFYVMDNATYGGARARALGELDVVGPRTRGNDRRRERR